MKASTPQGTRATDARPARAPTMIRFQKSLLDRIDAAAKRRGISRSAWVQYTLSKVLDDEQG